MLRPGGPAPARHRLLTWTDEFVRVPKVIARQSGRVIGRKTVPWPAAPGRVFRIPSSILEGYHPGEGPVTVSLG
jgi:hypothetical protein